MSFVKLSILFSENIDDEFIVLLTRDGREIYHDIFLEEFRQRGFRRCCRHKIPYYTQHIMLFNPQTKAKTPTQNIDRNRFNYLTYSQVMFFKTTWKSETVGLETGGGLTILPEQHEFKPRKELPEDIERHKMKDVALCSEGKEHAEHEASTSGYASRSTLSRALCSEKWEAASGLGLQTMFSGEAVTGQDIVDEVESMVSLRLKFSERKKQSEEGFRDVQAWLGSSKTRSTMLGILPTKDLDRKLGNWTETIVGPEGGDVSLRSYQIKIPPNAVQTETKFQFRVPVEMDLLKYPPDLIPISLPLYCSPGNVDFLTKVLVKLPTWVRKTNLLPNLPPIPVHVYTMRKSEDWQFDESAELSSTGIVEFKCEKFCAKAAFISASDAKRVMFSLEHILFKDNHGTYTSCHFLSTDVFQSAMFKHFEHNYEILHPPTYTSLAKHGDQIRINVLSRDPENYQFEAAEDDCILTIDENFYNLNRRESFSFLLTPQIPPSRSIEFTYMIGKKKFLKRDQIKNEPTDLPDWRNSMESADSSAGLRSQAGHDVRNSFMNIRNVGQVIVKGTHANIGGNHHTTQWLNRRRKVVAEVTGDESEETSVECAVTSSQYSTDEDTIKTPANSVQDDNEPEECGPIVVENHLYFKRSLSGLTLFILTCPAGDKVRTACLRSHTLEKDGYKRAKTLPGMGLMREHGKIYYTLEVIEPHTLLLPQSEVKLSGKEFFSTKHFSSELNLDPTPRHGVGLNYTMKTPNLSPRSSASQLPAENPISRPRRRAQNLTDVVPSVRVTNSEASLYQSHLQDTEVYQIDPQRPKGRVLIINNEFRGRANHHRLGSDVDRKNMEDLWTELGSDILPRLNLTAQEMRDACEEFAAEAKDVSYLVVIIMSHGYGAYNGKDFFCGEDDQRLLVDDVIMPFTVTESPHLDGIPKFFIFQACRGSAEDYDWDTADAQRIQGRGSQRADMLIAFATQPGHPAFLHAIDGSWFINAITRVFMEHAHDTHVQDMLTKVNAAVSRRRTFDRQYQITNHESYLRKKLFLFPGWP